MWVRGVSGLLLCLVGAVWILQGFDVVKGSGMSGHGIWAVFGIVLVAIGLALLRAANALRTRS